MANGNELKNTAGIGIINPGAGTIYGGFKTATGDLFGAGKTGQQQGGFDPGKSSDARLNQIFQNIKQNSQRGTFNEGQLNAAVDEYKKLQTDLQSGKISQADFARISDAFLPQITQFANQMAASGSAGANAVKGSLNQLNDFSKDYNIYKAGQELLGRDLTPQEVAQLKPRFADNIDTGRAYIAELAKQEANSPAALAKKAPQYSDQINKTFQSLLSRGATQEEADYFGRLLASGQVTPYEVNQFVQALPEYQNQQDKQFRSGLEGELAGYDEKAFARERENILSQYKRAGLDTSSALDYAITEALGKVQDQRGQFLAGLSSQQYGGNKDAARQDYRTNLDRYFGNQDYNRNRSDSYLDYLTQRADQGADYTRQKNDYLQFLSSQPKQRDNSLYQGLAAGGQLAGGIGQLIGGFEYLNA